MDPDICDEVSSVYSDNDSSGCHDNTVDVLQRGAHPLAYAAYFNRVDLIELLIQHHADVDLATNVSESKLKGLMETN